VEPVSTPTELPKESQVEPVTSTPPRETGARQAASGATGIGTGSTSSGASGTGPRSVVTPSDSGAGRKILGMSLPILAGGIIGVICLLGIGIYGIERLFTGGLGASPSTEEPIVLVVNTGTPTETAAPEPTITRTAPPTETPTETPIPPTPTPDTPYVLITDITLDGGAYVVDYEVHNFPESPQLHVHMFFDTVPPENAGAPGSGPWKLTWGPYGDPPFTQYGVANRPAAAKKMCSLVANPNHSVQQGTGNCMDLPEN